MRTAIRYSTAAIPMSSMYGAFTSAREIRSRKWTPYSHPCTSKESTFRMSTAERRRMLTQHFRQKSKKTDDALSECSRKLAKCLSDSAEDLVAAKSS